MMSVRLESEVASVGLDPAAAVISVLIEFSFPWVNVASGITSATPDTMGKRMGSRLRSEAIHSNMIPMMG